MPDLFLSYASEDADTAKKLHTLLEPLWEVAWDAPVAGNYIKWAEKTIPSARCFVVLLSPVAREKDTVLDEIRLARESKVVIIPVVIKECSIPYPCGVNMRVDLREWGGDPQASGYLQLVEKVSTLVAPRGKPPRLKEMLGGRIRLPCFYPSISSHNTRLKLPDALTAALQVPNLLISAYDTRERPVDLSGGEDDGWRAAVQRQAEERQEMLRLMEEYRSGGGLIMLDSGGYEAGRRHDKSWTREDLYASWADTPHDLAFCFDSDFDSLPENESQIVECVVRTVEKDRQQARPEATVLPIVHMPPATDGGIKEYRHEFAPRVLRGVAERLQPPLIAIPERELGNGIVERAQTVINIRKELSKLAFYQPIHVLGTGAPWAIAVLSAAGADSFDGLEWCRYVVDRNTGIFQHFHHLDFFSEQSLNKAKVPGCEAHVKLAAYAIEQEDVHYRAKVAWHNLSFYAEFIERLRFWAESGNFAAALVDHLRDYTKKLENDLPELFT